MSKLQYEVYNKHARERLYIGNNFQEAFFIMLSERDKMNGKGSSEGGRKHIIVRLKLFNTHYYNYKNIYANKNSMYRRIKSFDHLKQLPSFDKKVKEAAYFIYLNTGNTDHIANYYQALKQLSC